MKFLVLIIVGIIFFTPHGLCADSQHNKLELALQRFMRLRQESEAGIVRSEGMIRRASELVRLAREKGQTQTVLIAEKALATAKAARRRHQENKRKADAALMELSMLRGRQAELLQAEEQLALLREDVKSMQFALQLYRDSLLRNRAGMNLIANEISAASDKILVDGIGYLTGAVAESFLKDAVKHWKSNQAEEIDNFAELIDCLRSEKDLTSWLISSESKKRNLVKGADILAGAVIPGWEHVKMNFKAWSAVAKECLAWQQIDRYNRENARYARQIKDLSNRLARKVARINCLKQCMSQAIVGCANQCFGIGSEAVSE